MPVAAGFDSLCLLVAGGLFILPGFVSDALALLLLLPPVRLGLRVLLARRLVSGGVVSSWPAEGLGTAPGRPAGAGCGVARARRRRIGPHHVRAHRHHHGQP